MIATMAFATGLTVLAGTAAPARADTTATTVADATVYSNHPQDNAGGDPRVKMDASPTVYGYFKFDVRVGAGETITAAQFRCSVASLSAGRAQLYTTSSAWDENSITWDNAPRPDLSGPVAGRTGAEDGNGYVSADVTSAITGSGTYTLVGVTDRVTRWSCLSHETTHPAQLLITTEHAPVTGGHKVLVVLGENHSGRQALTQMPYLSAWAARAGEATNYSAVSHPSLPNYLAIFGGSTFGITSDCGVGSSGCVPDGPSVFGQTLAAGKSATAYQESMTSNCQSGSSGDYAAKHGPWPYWVDPTERAGCSGHDVPSGTPAGGILRDDIDAGRLPVTGELTPNLCNDAHDCNLGTFDAWLAQWVPALTAGPDYRSGGLTIIVTFDEDDGSAANNVAFVVIDPRLSGRTVTGAFDHYSLAKWLDDNAGVAELRNAASAPDLRQAFGL